MSRAERTILTVEDSELIRYQIAELLRENGFRVLEAGDGDSGLALAREHKPSLILLDVVMPGRNGFQTFRALRDDPDLKATPVVFITSKDQSCDRDYAERHGAAAYLTKPVDLGLLLECAERFA